MRAGNLGFRAVLLDFDLTIADSRPGFVASHGFAAAKVGLPEPDAEAVAASIGTPLHLAVRRLYGDSVQAVLDDYISIYQARADEVMAPLTTMLPGAADAVAELHAAGLRLAIVSQKLRYRVEEVLRREGLLDRFAVVLGGEDQPDFKPDPRGLLVALERLETAPGLGVFAGDTAIDADTARRAGVAFIALLSGTTPADAFKEYEPLAVLDSVAALPRFLGLAP